MRNVIYFMFLFFFFTGCGKEDNLFPSKEDRNWFVITGDSDLPVDQAIYDLYKKWEIPVFYNDTIGREERGVDYNGNPIIYYRILNLNYSINGANNTDFVEKRISLVKSEEDLLAGVRWVDEMLLPKMPKVFHQTSILLLDSLYNFQYGMPVLPLLEVYQGMETLAIGNIPAIAKMEQDECEEVVNRILVYLTTSYLSTKAPVKMDDFYKVSYNHEQQWTYYKVNVKPAPDYPGQTYLPSARWETYGFLDYDHSKYSKLEPNPTEEWWYWLPDVDDDVEDFVLAVLVYTPEEFEMKYQEYPKVKEKYTLMREILVDLGIVE